MATQSLTVKEIYQFYKDQVIALAPEFTDFSEGSLHDIMAGAFAVSMNELTELTLSEFQKTYFDTAEGSDLEILAKDHFGDTFSRPPAVKATGLMTFLRPTTGAGDVTIPAGTVVKTATDADGNSVSFETDTEAILTGLTIDLNVTAVVPGVAGNVNATLVNVLETTLTDGSVTVSNAAGMAGGQEEQEDSEYRETIKSLILALAGATKKAIRGAVLALPTIGFATILTIEKAVIEYDIGGEQILAGATYFRIPYPVIYVADEAGNSSPSIVAEAEAAIEPIKACGVKINVLGATSVALNWTASIALNAGGPNFAELSSDLTKVKDSMIEYINEKLAIGEGFSRSSANTYILSVWGPAGTGDLTSFSTTAPSGDVAVISSEKLIAGTMSIS